VRFLRLDILWEFNGKAVKIYVDMKYLVIACSIMKDELLRFQTNGISFVFMEQSLHRTPQKMKQAIQEGIDKAEQWDGDYIILSYGLCRKPIVSMPSRMPDFLN